MVPKKVQKPQPKKPDRAKPTRYDVRGVEHWWFFENGNGLRRRRDELEAIVEPFVTTQKTENTIFFRDKEQYLTVRIGGQDFESRLIYAAKRALYHLGDLEKAISSGDIAEVIDNTYAFARCDFDVEACKLSGWDAGEAVAQWGLDKVIARIASEGRASGPKKQKLLTGENEKRLLKILSEKYSDLPPKKRSEKMADEIYDRHGLRNLKGGKISAETIARRCIEYGFWGSSTVAP
jgi:hypothetical protein